MSDLHGQRSKGDRAKKLLEHPLLIEAFREIHENLHANIDGMVGGSREELADRLLAAKHQLDGLRALKSTLQKYVNQGKQAAFKIEEQQRGA